MRKWQDGENLYNTGQNAEIDLIVLTCFQFLFFIPGNHPGCYFPFDVLYRCWWRALAGRSIWIYPHEIWWAFEIYPCLKLISHKDGTYMGCFCGNRDGFNLKKKKRETQSINQIIEVNVLGHIGGKERGYNSQQWHRCFCTCKSISLLLL